MLDVCSLCRLLPKLQKPIYNFNIECSLNQPMLNFKQCAAVKQNMMHTHLRWCAAQTSIVLRIREQPCVAHRAAWKEGRVTLACVLHSAESNLFMFVSLHGLVFSRSCWQVTM